MQALPEPSWFGNAFGGLIQWAIVTLPLVAWKGPWRWIRIVAGVVWTFAVAAVLYYWLRGIQFPPLPPFLFWRFTLWKVLGVEASTLVVVALALRLWRATRPAIDPDAGTTWAGLTALERRFLSDLWNSPGAKVAGAHFGMLQAQGGANWNSLTESLGRQGLVASLPREIALSAEGRALMLWVERAGDSAGGATQSPGQRWERLSEHERLVLALLVSHPKSFVDEQELDRYGMHWGVVKYKRVMYSLANEGKLIAPDYRLVATTVLPTKRRGFVLTGAGKDLMMRLDDKTIADALQTRLP